MFYSAHLLISACHQTPAFDQGGFAEGAPVTVRTLPAYSGNANTRGPCICLSEGLVRDMLTQFPIQYYPELSKEEVSGRLGLKRLGRLQDGLILQLVGDGFHLKNIRINPMLPEPVRRSELDMTWVNRRNSCKGFAESPPTTAVLYAKGDVGDSVPYQVTIATRDRLQTVRVLLRSAYEVPIAALQGEAVRERGETTNDVHNRFVD